jgi:Raf kinase inhibitor-like YbhB/YbcL family protein
MDMTITSSAFAHNGSIPKLYTCEGKDISPPLAWGGVPNGAKSLVMIVDDPDAPDPAAPRRTWVHWLLYNLPVDSSGLPEAVHSLPAGTLNGLNDWQRSGYGGPCPPIGRHRYFLSAAVGRNQKGVAPDTAGFNLRGQYPQPHVGGRPPHGKGGDMDIFLKKHQESILGVVEGFDRIIFKGY